MTDSEKGKSPLRRRLSLIAIVVGIILMVLTVIVAHQGWFGGKDSIRVDFSDVATDSEGQTTITEDVRPVLRIAG